MTNSTPADLEARLAALEADAQTPLRDRIDAMNDLAWEIRLADWQRSIDLSQAAYALSKADPVYLRGQAWSLRNLSVLLRRQDMPRALAYALEALGLVTLEEEPILRAEVLAVMGSTYAFLADYAQALTHYLQALKIAVDHEDATTRCKILNDMGIVYRLSNQPERAMQTWTEALDLARTLDIAPAVGSLLHNIGEMHLIGDDLDAAEDYLQRALTWNQTHSFRIYEAVDLTDLATLHARQGRYDQALRDVDQAEAILTDLGSRLDLITLHIALAEIYQWMDNLPAAVETLRQTLVEAEEMGARAEQFRCHELLAEVFAAQNDYEAAYAHYKQFHELKVLVFNETEDQKLKLLQVAHDTERAKQEAEIYRLKNVELQAALDQVKQLSGLVPICANCKSIRDDEGYWHQVEVYISQHSGAEFSHGLCPECLSELYPQFFGTTVGSEDKTGSKMKESDSPAQDDTKA